jgi:hypothetical protein
MIKRQTSLNPFWKSREEVREVKEYHLRKNGEMEGELVNYLQQQWPPTHICAF